MSFGAPLPGSADEAVTAPYPELSDADVEVDLSSDVPPGSADDPVTLRFAHVAEADVADADFVSLPWARAPRGRLR